MSFMYLPQASNKTSVSGAVSGAVSERNHQKKLQEHQDYSFMRKDPFYFSRTSLGLRSPLYLPDMEKAILYFREVFSNSNSHIYVIGDRDVDGVSSTALLGGFLQEHYKGKYSLLVSDEDDDYGLCGRVFEQVYEAKADLVFLLDLGSTHGPEIDILAKAGSRIIVLDHHLLHTRTPTSPSCAFVNPQRDTSLHPGHEGKIATAGLTFQFLFALALSHTDEWKRMYFLSDPSSLHTFRCGMYLGSFSSIEEWEKQEKNCNIYEKIMIRGKEDDSYPFSECELEQMKLDTDYGGKMLLAAAVESRPRLKRFIRKTSDLAAVGILADLVPLVAENRSLARMGTRYSAPLSGRASGTEPPQNGESHLHFREGYLALIRALRIKRLSSRNIGWSIAPAINAAGRMGNTRLALDLLMSTQADKAAELAKELISLNQKRKKRTLHNEEVLQKHLEENPKKKEEPILFCWHPDLEPGVSGIIASRLSEKYKHPVIYINPNGSHARGSARSWNKVNMLALLDKASDLFLQFGGHQEACGFSISYDKINDLEARILKTAREDLNDLKIQKLDSASTLPYHLKVQPREIGYDLYEELEELEPFGPANPEPILYLPCVRPVNLYLMSEGVHASFQLEETPSNVKFIGWRFGKEISQIVDEKKDIDLYGALELSGFRGREELQFRISNLRTSSLVQTQSNSPPILH